MTACQATSRPLARTLGVGMIFPDDCQTFRFDWQAQPSESPTQPPALAGFSLLPCQVPDVRRRVRQGCAGATQARGSRLFRAAHPARRPQELPTGHGGGDHFACVHGKLLRGPGASLRRILTVADSSLMLVVCVFGAQYIRIRRVCFVRFSTDQQIFLMGMTRCVLLRYCDEWF